MGKKHVEIIVRGVMVCEGKLLLCHTKGADNTYLPGGHVDFGEDARAALKREIDEEMGCQVTVSEFLGACEHSFIQKGKPHHEINLVFRMAVEGLDAGRDPESREDYIEFLWEELDALESSVLEPACLRGLIGSWLSGGGSDERWASGVIPESR